MSAATAPARQRSDRGVVALFSLTMLVSAMLLFAVQPMVARFVLPAFGSAPSVWAVALVFFQAVLLLGYLYAHVSSSRLGPHRALGLHAVLLLLPAIVLPLGVPAVTADAATGNPALALLGLLAVSIGLPFFVVSSTAPLLQRWLVNTDHPAGRDPYFLYRASNLGSVIGLVSYPLLVEPRLALDDQGQLWTWGYAVLVVLLLGCAAFVWRSRSGTRAVVRRRRSPTSADGRPAPEVDGARVRPVIADRRRDLGADDRRGADPAAVGAPARALPDLVHDRVLGRERARGPSTRSRSGCSRSRSLLVLVVTVFEVRQPAVVDHRRAPARGVRRGDGLPRAARAGPAGGAAADDLLPHRGGRRGPRRRVRRAAGPARVRRLARVPARARAGRGAVAGVRPPAVEAAEAGARGRCWPVTLGIALYVALTEFSDSRVGEHLIDRRRRRDLPAVRRAPARGGSRSASPRCTSGRRSALAAGGSDVHRARAQLLRRPTVEQPVADDPLAGARDDAARQPGADAAGLPQPTTYYHPAQPDRAADLRRAAGDDPANGGDRPRDGHDGRPQPARRALDVLRDRPGDRPRGRATRATSPTSATRRASTEIVLGDARLSLQEAPRPDVRADRRRRVQLRRDPDPPDHARGARAVLPQADGERRRSPSTSPTATSTSSRCSATWPATPASTCLVGDSDAPLAEPAPEAASSVWVALTRSRENLGADRPQRAVDPVPHRTASRTPGPTTTRTSSASSAEHALTGAVSEASGRCQRVLVV